MSGPGAAAALAALLPPGSSGRLTDLLPLLLRLARAERRRVLPALLAAAGLATLALLPPWLLAQLLDHAFPSRASSLAIALAAGLLGAALLDAALAWLRRLLAAEAALETRRRLLLPAYAAMLRLQSDDPLRHDHGVLSQTFEEVDRLARGASEEAVEISLGLGTVVLLSGAMLVLEPKLGALVLILSAGLVGLHLVAGRRLRRREAAWFETRSRHWAHLVESIAYSDTVRLNGAHAFAEERFASRLAGDLQAQRAVIRVAALLDGAGRLSGGLIMAAIALLGGAEVIAGRMSIGHFVLFLAIGGALSAPLLGLATSLSGAQAASHAHGRLARLAQARLEAVDHGTPRPPAGQPRLVVEGLTFRHPGSSRPVLQDFCCCIDAGERVALLGASGIGKSTLASLLFRLREPDAGRILLDGVPLQAIPLELLRRRIRWVPHQIDVFTGSIAENIRLADPSADHRAITAAAEAAGLADDIGRQAEGYDTLLGPGNLELSAGQRQRLGIARAILAAPEILILDESTASLDADTEARVLQGVEQALPGTAILAITHRASVAARMDRVLRLDGATA